MSQEGYDKLVAELRRLESIERPKASAAIAEARDKGDLSENSEYDAAKEAQAHLESKINKMKLTIAEAKIVDMSRLSTDTVQIMCKVEMTNMANQATSRFPTASSICASTASRSTDSGLAPTLYTSTQTNNTIMATIFTKIAAGEIPSYKCAESADFYAFLDISPLTKGHTLVIPRKEVDYIFDMDDAELAAFQVFAKKVAQAIRAAFPCRKVAQVVLGLEVPHAHIHLMPINSEADVDFRKEHLSLEPEEMQRIADSIYAEFQKL